MTVWLVKVTWFADEAETSEQWVANAATIQDAVKDVTAHIHFHPHHVEAKRCDADDKAYVADLPPGRAQRIAPQ